MKIKEKRVTSRTFSKETRLKMSESAKRRCQDPKWIEAQKARGTQLDLEVFKHLYYDLNMTQTEVAKEMGVSQKVVFSFMRRHGLEARTAAKRYQQREANDSWKGGRRINEQGYVEIYMPEYGHTRYNGYVREHIYVAEKMLGRRLKYYGPGNPENEVVHHINGNKLDNNPNNLLVLSALDHIKIHNAVSKEQIDEVLLNRIRQLEEEIATTKLRFPESEV